MEYRNMLIHVNVEIIMYTFVLFFVPFLIGGPQWLVGAMVNAALVLGAMNLKLSKMMPLIILPSLAVLTRGVIFGPFTVFLLYMIPFIWLSNTILVYMVNRFGRYKGLVLGIFLKAGFLFTSAWVMVSMGVIPSIFLTTMGLMQLYTAMSGGAAALGVQKAREKIQKRFSTN